LIHRCIPVRVEELSYPTWEWIEELRLESKVRSFWSGASRMLELLDRIDKACEPAAAIELVAVLPQLSGAVRVRTATVVERLLTPMTAREILRFSDRTRYGLRRLDKFGDRTSWLDGPDTTMTGVRAACTCHPDGYIREAALRQLHAHGDSFVVGFALLRLSDWVPQVRAAAAEVLGGWIEEGRGEEWTRWIEILCRVARAAREDQVEFIRRIESMVGKTTEVLGALESPEQEVRRYAYALALPRAEALQRGLRSPDPVIRLRSAEFALQRDPTLADALSRDPYPPIRKVVLHAHPELAHQFLFDSARSVRAFARGLLDQDAAPIYRAVLDKGEPGRLTAWRGLAECAEKGDAARFAGALSNPRPTVRAAALGGLARIADEPPLEEAWSAMGDSSPRVRRAGLRILMRHPLAIDESRVRQFLAVARQASQVRHALALASALPKWASGPLLLEATRSVHTELAQARVVRWLSCFNRSFEIPTAAQAVAFRSAVTNAGVDESLRGTLEHILRTM